MSDNFDDMPEIELDDIVSPSAAPDDDAIELDLDLQPTPIRRTSPSAIPLAQDDDDAIDLGLDLSAPPPSAPRPTAVPTVETQAPLGPLGDIDVDALASQVAQSQPEIDDTIPVLPEGATEPPAVTERPSVPAPGEGAVDLDALLADIDTGLPTTEPGPSRIQSNVEALPDIDADALSALNFQLDESPASTTRDTQRRGTVELRADDVDLDDGEDDTALEPLDAQYTDPGVEMNAHKTPTIEAPALRPQKTVEVEAIPDAAEAELQLDALTETLDGPSEGETELDAELEVEPEPSEFSPEPLLEVLADEPTIAAVRSAPEDEASLQLDRDEPTFSFQAEHAPIGDGLDGESVPMTVSPIDDPDAPSLPLSSEEPVGRPKVPLEQLKPDPKTIETLKRLAGPGGDPEKARKTLLAAFRGEGYDPRGLPDGRDIAVGLGRYLVQQGHDADALAETIVAVMLE
ncbi:MAG: hypothetical protein AAFY60_06835 [Myxococcota bacterium]